MEMTLNFGTNTPVLLSFFERLKNLKRSKRIQIAEHGTSAQSLQALEAAGKATEKMGIDAHLNDFVNTHGEMWFCDHAPKTLWLQTMGAVRALAVGETAIGKENFDLLYSPFAEIIPLESLKEMNDVETLAGG
jgi:hypothetical protein